MVCGLDFEIGKERDRARTEISWVGCSLSNIYISLLENTSWRKEYDLMAISQLLKRWLLPCSVYSPLNVQHFLDGSFGK